MVSSRAQHVLPICTNTHTTPISNDLCPPMNNNITPMPTKTPWAWVWTPNVWHCSVGATELGFSTPNHLNMCKPMYYGTWHHLCIDNHPQTNPQMMGTYYRFQKHSISSFGDLLDLPQNTKGWDITCCEELNTRVASRILHLEASTVASQDRKRDEDHDHM